jgi:PIN domain nuclease of toxin-antitoxin system
MAYVVDTHAILWFLEDSPKLTQAVADVLEDPESRLVVPTIALAELWHMHVREKTTVSLGDAMALIDSLNNCEVHPFDEAILNILPAGLEIHDAIIVATAMALTGAIAEPVRVLTHDKRITESGLVDVLW